MSEQNNNLSGREKFLRHIPLIVVVITALYGYVKQQTVVEHHTKWIDQYSGLINSIGTESDPINTVIKRESLILQNQLDEFKRRIDDLKTWQEEWQEGGQLKEDVDQNARLKFLEKCIERIMLDVKELRRKLEKGPRP